MAEENGNVDLMDLGADSPLLIDISTNDSDLQVEGGGSSGNLSESAQSTKLEDTLADYQPPKRYNKKEEKPDVGPNVYITPTDSQENKPSPKQILGGAGSNNMCKRCNKRVYEMEKMIADKDIYHKMCFRCIHCKRILSLGNYAAIDGAPYCKPHFIELFKKKGRYDMNTAKPKSDEPRVETNMGENGQKEVREETQAPEPMRCPQMSSVRNMFESASRESSPARPLNQRTPSKWDKPKDTAPHEVSARQERVDNPEPAAVEDMPPPSITRNLVARFREMEQSGGEIYVPDRKSLHKITPPRDELARGIAEAIVHNAEPHPSHVDTYDDRDAAEDEVDEMPPPLVTRKLVDKFRCMEELSPVAPRTSPAAPVQRSVSLRNSPKPVVPSDMPVLQRQMSDPTLSEEVNELPAQGFTRGLVAKWRNMEDTSQTSAPPKPKVSLMTTSATEMHRAYDQNGTGHDDHDDDDGNSELSEQGHDGRDTEQEYLPPPSFTRNMLAKFQSLEAEAERQVQEQPHTTKKTENRETVGIQVVSERSTVD